MSLYNSQGDDINEISKKKDSECEKGEEKMKDGMQYRIKRECEELDDKYLVKVFVWKSDDDVVWKEYEMELSKDAVDICREDDPGFDLLEGTKAVAVKHAVGYILQDE